MKTECILIKVRRRGGSYKFQSIIVHGWPTGLPGLYVTLDYDSAEKGLKRYGYTHTLSGLGFHSGTLGCKRVAIRYARKYFRVIDWTLGGDRVAMQPGVVEAYNRSARDLTFK